MLVYTGATYMYLRSKTNKSYEGLISNLNLINVTCLSFDFTFKLVGEFQTRLRSD